MDGHDVRVLDNFATGRRENVLLFANDVELIEGDIQSYERAHNAVQGCEVVFHQAALPSVPRSVQDPLTSNATNVVGTLNILLASRDAGVRRVVSASSSSVYGSNPALPKREDMPTAPISPYAVAKLAAEGYCRSFTEVFGLETVALRYFNVFGERQDPTSHYSAVIPKFITAMLARVAPVINGDGEQSRDFTFVSNVVDANLLAASSPTAVGHAINIACGDRISLNQLCAAISEALPGTPAPEHGPARVGDVPHSLADISRARELLGYEPAIDFNEGLRRSLDYYESIAPTLTGA